MVYNWIKGAHPEVLDHMFNLFSSDKSAIYFITHEEWPDPEMIPRGIVYRGSITGVLSFLSNSGTMKLNFYSKTIPREHNKNSSILSKKILKAFKQRGSLKVMNNKDKEKILKKTYEEIKTN